MEQPMTFKEFAQEIHENAVAHGWWDEPRTDAEIIALIHSEWSEALEESRAGRPMVWHNCDVCCDEYGTKFCETATEEACINLFPRKTCKYRSSKPEGIAIELIDGVIRIFDYMATQTSYIQNVISEERTSTFILPPNGRLTGTESAATIVADLHALTANAYDRLDRAITFRGVLLTAASNALYWVQEHGINPWTLLLEKHEYNKTRPYKHGKQF